MTNDEIDSVIDDFQKARDLLDSAMGKLMNDRHFSRPRVIASGAYKLVGEAMEAVRQKARAMKSDDDETTDHTRS